MTTFVTSDAESESPEEKEHMYLSYESESPDGFELELQETQKQQQLLVCPAGLSGFTYGAILRYCGAVPFVSVVLMMLALCASYAALGVRELVRHVFVKTSFMWDLYLTLGVSLWIVLQKRSFEYAKDYLVNQKSLLQWTDWVSTGLTMLALLSQVVGWLFLLGLCPTIFTHGIVQFLHCEGAPVTVHAQANIRLLIFAVTDLGDKLEFLVNHGALKDLPGRPKIRDLLCVLVMARHVLWLTLDQVLRIQHDQNSLAGYQLVRVIEYIVLTPYLLEMVQWLVNLQCTLPHMLVNKLTRNKPYVLSCRYDSWYTVYYTVVIGVCQTLFTENFSDSVIIGCTFLLARYHFRGVFLRCKNLWNRSHYTQMNKHSGNQRSSPAARPVTNVNKRSAQPKIYDILGVPWCQLGLVKIVFTQGNKFWGPQPWKPWNEIQCVCKPEKSDPLFWFFLGGSLVLLGIEFWEQWEQDKIKDPVKWFFTGKMRAIVVILTAGLPVCLAVYETNEWFMLAVGTQVLETVNASTSSEFTNLSLSAWLDLSNWTLFADNKRKPWIHVMNGVPPLNCKVRQ